MLFARAELGRSKLRFGGLTVGAGLLIFVLLFQQALLTAVLDGMAGAIKQQSGTVVVYTKASKRSLGIGPVSPEQAAKIAAVPGVGATGNLGLGAMTYTLPGSDARTNVSVIGYQPGKAGEPTGVREGRMPQAPDEVVASAEGAKGKFAVGDTLTIQPGNAPVTVVGLTEGALMSMGPALWMSWDTFVPLAKKAMPYAPVLPAVIAVQPAPGVSTEQVIKDINALPEFDAMTRVAAAEAAPGRGPIASAFFGVMLLVYVVVGVVIGFFFLTITLQKERSITMLRAVGATAGYLISCLMLEVAVVMSGGLVVGVLLLYLVKPALSNIVIIEISPVGVLFTAFPAVMVALAGTLPPIRRMLRTNPNDVVSKPMLGTVG
jgi:putative ABC transport system permease protein